MSYAICRIQKCKAADVTGLQIHDQREKDHSNTNPDIDFTRSSLNYNLHTDEHVIYRRAVNDRIAELDLPRAVRKDATVMAQVMVTSDTTFFDKLDPMEQRRFFQTAYDFMGSRYGRENIISAEVHMDEKTPHMHLSFVPVTPDGRLCAKEVFKPSEYHDLQTAFHARMTAAGYDLERGVTRDEKRQHYETQEYKAMTAQERAQDAQKAQQEAEKAKDSTQGELERLRRDTEQAQQGLKEVQKAAARTTGTADKYAEQKRATADREAEKAIKDAQRDAADLRGQAEKEARQTVAQAKGEADAIRAEIPALRSQRDQEAQELERLRANTHFADFERGKPIKTITGKVRAYEVTPEQHDRYVAMRIKYNDQSRDVYMLKNQVGDIERVRGERDSLTKENRQLRHEVGELKEAVTTRDTYIGRIHTFFDQNPEIGTKAMDFVHGLEKEAEKVREAAEKAVEKVRERVQDVFRSR